ncbi:MAG TPA: hypothetical protein VGZ69_01315 [Candidatus Rhabdochlamydia sp.]|jgi:hypothetical protein|nr:hypothetical protein [Candidatus Rhabdochlamydia sp.]
MSTSVTIFCFPKKEELINNLEKHPKLSFSPYFTEKKIIEKVADFFAEEEKDSDGLNLGVALCLYHLKILPAGQGLMRELLVQALEGCANIR